MVNFANCYHSILFYFIFNRKKEYLFREDCNFIIVYWVDIQDAGTNGLSVVRITQMAADHTG